MNDYLKQRTLEALGSTKDNNLQEATNLLAEWALQDSRLLQAIAAPWLKSAAAKSIEAVAIETLQKSKIPPRKPSQKTLKKMDKGNLKTVTYRHKRGSATPPPLIGGSDPIIQTIIGNMHFKDANPASHKSTLHCIAKAHAEKRLLKSDI